MRRLLFALALVLAPASARAGGFAVGESDAAASGRAGTAAARFGDAAGITHNPASLAGVQGVAGGAGATVISASASAVDPAGGPEAATTFAPKVPPHVFAAYGQDKLAFGLGIDVPFGGGLKWPDDWRGRHEIVDQELQVLGFHVGGAYRITDVINAGLELAVYRATVLVDKRVDFVDHEGQALIGGAGTGVGGSLGLGYGPVAGLRFGASFRLPTKISLEGNAHFGDVPPAFANLLQDQGIASTLPLPARLSFGAELEREQLRLFTDVDLTFWSSFQSFDVAFSKSAALNVSAPRNWETSPTVKVGAEYALAQATVRAGLSFDGQVSPADTISPSLPDSRRLGLSLGAGKDLPFVHLDGAYSFVTFFARQTEGEALPAEYHAHAHLFSLTARWRGAAE